MGATSFVDGFSPDGTEIYYQTLGRGEEWAVPTLGGAPRPLVTGVGLIPSSDGSTFYYTKWERRAIFQSSSSGLNEQEIYRFEDFLEFYLLYPDQKHLLAGTRPSGSPGIQLHRVNRESRTAEDLGTLDFLTSAEWGEPGETLLLNRTVQNLTNIWKYDLGKRTFTQLTFGPGPDFSPMADPSGNGFYFVSGKTSGRLTAYNAKTGATIDLVNEWASEPIVSPDGKRVMFKTSPQQGDMELWVSDIDGRNQRKLASVALLTTGAWSPDGSHVSFTDHTAGDHKIFTVGVDGMQSQGDIDSSKSSWAGWSGHPKVFITPAPRDWTSGRSAPTALRQKRFWKDARWSRITSLVGSSSSELRPVEPRGIYVVSLLEKRCIPLVPGILTMTVRSAVDGRSILYAVSRRARDRCLPRELE